MWSLLNTGFRPSTYHENHAAATNNYLYNQMSFVCSSIEDEINMKILKYRKLIFKNFHFPPIKMLKSAFMCSICYISWIYFTS